MKTKYNSAFSLVEVAVALAIAAFSLIPVLGLLPLGLNSSQSSIAQTTVASLARAIVADIRATKAIASQTVISPQYRIAVASPTSAVMFLREDGSAVAGDDLSQDARYRATLTFTPPSTPMAATAVHVLITWPAAATANYCGAYEITTALNLN